MKQWAMAIVLLAVAIATRTWGGLGVYPPYAASDEINAALSARRAVSLSDPSTWYGYWESGLTRTFLLPLKIAQTAVSDDLAGTRAAHAALGVITVAAMYGFARLLIGDWPAWCGAMLFAVAHAPLHFSRVVAAASTQSTAALALLLWALAAARGSRPRYGAWLAAGLTLGWALQTYQLAYGYPLLAVWAGADDVGCVEG